MPIINMVYKKKERTKIYDFQNNGDLWWTSFTDWAWTCSIVANQWWQITRSGYPNMSCWIWSPSSIYKWTLKKFKYYMYKSWNAACWIIQQTEMAWIEYGRDNWKLNVLGTTIANITLNWEIEVECDFNDDGNTYIKLSNSGNTYNYTSTGTASTFRGWWASKNFNMFLWKWSNNNPVYLRKIEITTY